MLTTCLYCIANLIILSQPRVNVPRAKNYCQICLFTYIDTDESREALLLGANQLRQNNTPQPNLGIHPEPQCGFVDSRRSVQLCDDHS